MSIRTRPSTLNLTGLLLSVYGFTYLTIIFLSCLAAFFVTLKPKFDAPKYRPLRGILFVFIGVGSAFPTIHYMYYRLVKPAMY